MSVFFIANWIGNGIEPRRDRRAGTSNAGQISIATVAGKGRRQLDRESIIRGSLRSNIPSDDSQRTIVSTFGDSLCQDESFAEMGVLARIRDNLALQLSRAVALAPHYLRSYIQHSRTANSRPAQCGANATSHDAFLKALDELATDLCTGITRYVIRPEPVQSDTYP